jgi:hypothetical protein
VLTATIDTYASHIVPDLIFDERQLEFIKTRTGLAISLLKNLSNLKVRLANDGFVEDYVANCTNLWNQIAETLDNLPSPDFLNSLNLSCTKDVFLEILIMSIKNSCLAYQHNLFKIKNMQKSRFGKKIDNLKLDFIANAGEILRTERELDRIIELELREEVAKMQKFERLNNEKITPYFMSLAKQPNVTSKLSDITKDDGTPFESSVEQNEYIREYYANTYKKVENNNNNISIESFLGEVATEEVVLSSKLNEDERNELEMDLRLEEFDAAIDQAKLNTSPGIDTISNRFIKRFWNIFRKPLYDYTIHCYGTGRLTDNFRSAKIRLIPKKGNLGILKNWRPISLLNCFYKIISRVIANRLKTVMDKITKVAQKGFSSSKYCQEVLISIVDSISNLNFRKKSAAVLSLDIKKAFDSTSHTYLQNVYGFFGFGPNFIRWLNLICTNRRACLILDNGLYSDFFYLLRGNAQGDTVSPYVFNLGFQILLFKLTFTLQIEGLIDFPDHLENLPPLPTLVSTYQRKVFAFADDANMIVKLEYNSLAIIKKILTDFGILSGLVCNVDKTTLLPIGPNIPIDPRILDLGFKIVNSVTILGLTIEGATGDMNCNFISILSKIRREVQNWSRFNLSLPGRIAIAKTMMYSQINYLGCFLEIPTEILLQYDTLITNFVKGNMNIARNRLYKHPSHGGLGLFNLSSFLCAQQCTWVRRSLALDEQWKIEFFYRNNGIALNCKSKNFKKLMHPTLFLIAGSFEKFYTSFTKHNKNFKKCFIFENALITRNLDDRQCLTKDIMGRELFNNYRNSIYGLRYDDFYTENNELIPYVTVQRKTGIPFSPMQIQIIRSFCTTARIKFSKKNENEQKVLDVRHLMTSKNKSSSRLRKILDFKYELGTPRNIKKFAENMDIIVNGEQSLLLNSLWTLNFFSNNMRTFLFKFHNNTLGYNASVAHFVHGHSALCTFCNILRNGEGGSETPLHLFYDCPPVQELIVSLFRQITNDDNFEITAREYFSTFERRDFSIAKNKALTYISDIFYLVVS